MKRVWHKLEAKEPVKIINLLNNSLNIISLNGITLISNLNVAIFVYGTNHTITYSFFTPSVFDSEEYILDIYKYKSMNFFEIKQFVNLLRVKTLSKYFPYNKTKERQLKLLFILEDYLADRGDFENE